MFQMLGDCGVIRDFYTTFEHMIKAGCVVHANLRGSLGTSVDLQTLLNTGLQTEVIGSVKFSFDVNGTKASALVFNTGSCKICGGFPIDVKNSADQSMYNKYLDACKDHFERITELKLDRTRLICINGQFHIDRELSNLLELDAFVGMHRHKFDRVKQPNLDMKGRRGAYKLYLHGKKNTHIAIDHKGTCQVFACKSVAELFGTFEMLSRS